MAKATIPVVGGARLGGDLVISLAPEKDGYVHTLKYSFGAASGIIADKVKTVHVWTVPLELANQIPNSATGNMALTCDTYDGSGAYIGSETISVEAQVPNDERTRPDVAVSVELLSDLPAPFNGLFICGKTKLKATYVCAGKYGATIAGYYSYLNPFYETSRENPATLKLHYSSNTEESLMVEVTDSRGFRELVRQNLQVIPYRKPSIVPYGGEEKVICSRCNQDGTVDMKGEYLLIKARCSCYPVESNGKALNSCRLRLRYKEYNAEDYSAWHEVITEGAEEHSVCAVQTGIRLGKNAYEVQLQVVDTIGETEETVVHVSETKAQLHLGKGGKNVAVGQYCDYSHENAFDIGYTAWFNAGVGKRTIFEGVEWNTSTATSFGNPITDVTQDANLALMENYTLFVAVYDDGYPELCVKHDMAVRGGSLVMLYSAPDILWLSETEKTVTALYAIL